MNKMSFNGTTRECLHHYAENFLPPKGARNSGQAKEPMAHFVGVNTDTITSWISDRNKPLGGPLVKLRFYLEAVGYDVVELRNLRGQVNYMLAEMLAYGLLTVEQAAKQLGFGKHDSVYRIAHGGSNTSSDRVAKIQEMYESHHPELNAAKMRLSKELGKAHDAQVVSFPQPDSHPSAQGAVDDESIATLAHFVMAITPLLEKAVTETTREQRNKLRKLTGDDGMFRLSKASSRLCSEKAREVVNNH